MLSLGGLRTESLHTLDVSEVRLPKKGNFWTFTMLLLRCVTFGTM